MLSPARISASWLLIQRRTDEPGVHGQNGVIRHLAGVPPQRNAFNTRQHVNVQVEHGLACCRFIELLDQHTFGAKSLAGSARDLLHRCHQWREVCRISVEKIA